jgi:hypothetical protein
MMAKRGRPTLAAQSLEEALERYYRGDSPKRPRNLFERQAMLQSRGRKPEPQSMTRQAANYAAYLVKNETITITAASKRASLAYKVDAANIRRYAKAILEGPQVILSQRKAQWYGYAPPRKMPLLVSVRNVVKKKPRISYPPR